MKSWEKKKLHLEQAVAKINRGAHVYIGNGSATPFALIHSMSEPMHELVDIEIIQFLHMGVMPYLETGNKRFRTNTFYVGDDEFPYIRDGYADYTPASASDIPRFVQEERIKIDVALIKVTPPNSKGFCSLGVGVDMTLDLLDSATLVIAEVSDAMPWTYGPSQIPCERIDFWVESGKYNALPEVPTPQPCEEDYEIGANAAKLVEDQATLRLAWRWAEAATQPHLSGKVNLGLHTEVLTKGMVNLIKEGVITNSHKRTNRGVSVVSHCIGDKEVFDFVNRNKKVEFHPLSYTNNIANLAKIDKLTVITEANGIDLTGQTVSDSIGHEFYGGFGGTLDFFRGASLSKGGKPIVALRSTRNNNTESSIMPSLQEGSGVAVTRADVHYVVTEYGIADLYGLTIRERCMALMEIAHPRFRESLLVAAKRHHYVSQRLPGYSLKSIYPAEWESEFITDDGELLLGRPVKASDEKMFRDFFHKLSDRNIYLRYFRQMRSLPFQVLQGFVDIDYSRNMSIIMLSRKSNHDEIVAVAQWVIDEQDGIPELAFQVRDDYQAKGLGKYLLFRLIEIAQERHFRRMKAEVLSENKAMRTVFERGGYPTKTKTEFGVVTIEINIVPDFKKKLEHDEVVEENTP